MENENMNQTNEVTNATVTITDLTEKPKKRNFLVRFFVTVAEYHDKELHPVAARVIHGTEVVLGIAIATAAIGAYVDHKVAAGKLPANICNEMNEEDEIETDDGIYEGTCEEQGETESEESDKDTTEETEEKIAE